MSDGIFSVLLEIWGILFEFFEIVGTTTKSNELARKRRLRIRSFPEFVGTLTNLFLCPQKCRISYKIPKKHSSRKELQHFSNRRPIGFPMEIIQVLKGFFRKNPKIYILLFGYYGSLFLILFLNEEFGFPLLTSKTFSIKAISSCMLYGFPMLLFYIQLSERRKNRSKKQKLIGFLFVFWYLYDRIASPKTSDRKSSHPSSKRMDLLDLESFSTTDSRASFIRITVVIRSLSKQNETDSAWNEKESFLCSDSHFRFINRGARFYGSGL